MTLLDFIAEPWRAGQVDITWRVLALALPVSVACGWIGVHLILRRMAFAGDAVSHGVLPGLAVAALLSHSLSGPVVIVGAIAAGLLTTFLMEWIPRHSPIKPDAATGVVFTSLFAAGVFIVSLAGRNLHLDAECILYGNLADAALRGSGLSPSVWQAILVAALGILLNALFHKELLVTAFDPVMASSLGISARTVGLGLMVWLSVVVVTAFEAVGSVLVVGMLVIPGATALLLTNRLWVALLLSALHGLLSVVPGWHFALWLDCNAPAAMVVTGLLWFLLAWLFSPRHGLVTARWRHLAEEPGP